MTITSEPHWLDATFTHLLHRESLQQHGGSDGVRDHGLLESALGRPQHRYVYTPDVTLADLAASYGFGIVRNHPFIDGNKRTGLLAIRAFLYLNGWILDPDQEDAIAVIVSLASGEVDEDQLAAWIIANSHPR